MIYGAKEVIFTHYAQYMWEIVYAYFENLKVHRKYAPLKLLEKRIIALKDKDGANWLASSMVKLRRSYLYKPSNISKPFENTTKQNIQRQKDTKLC